MKKYFIIVLFWLGFSKVSFVMWGSFFEENLISSENFFPFKVVFVSTENEFELATQFYVDHLKKACEEGNITDINAKEVEVFGKELKKQQIENVNCQKSALLYFKDKVTGDVIGNVFIENQEKMQIHHNFLFLYL